MGRTEAGGSCPQQPSTGSWRESCPRKDSGSHLISYFGFVLFLTILFASRFWEGYTNINLSEAPTLVASATAPKAWTGLQLMLPQALSNAGISYIKGPSGG